MWRASTRASIIREMEFRANFIAGLTRQLLWLLVFIFMVDVIFGTTEQLAGWHQSEVLVLIGISRIVEGLMGVLFVQNIMELPNLVRDGKFDFHLLKPVPAQLYTAFRRTNIDNFGNVIAGVLLTGYALIAGTITPGLPAILLALLVIAAGITIYYSLLIITATLVFYIDRLEFLWGFNILLSEPLTVPFDIFPRLPRVTLTYLIPIAFVVFVPAQALTGRLVWWHTPLALGLAALFLLIANAVWRTGIRKYSSASS